MNTTINYSIGETVVYKSSYYKIKKLVDLNKVIVCKLSNSREINTVKVSELSLPQEESEKNIPEREIMDINTKDWETAKNRFAIIEPMLANTLTTKEIKNISLKCSVHVSTLYRWKERYETTGKLSSLAPDDRSGGRGQSRMEEEIEEIMRSSIESIYLNSNRRSIKRTIEEINQRCKAAQVLPPCDSTIRKRIDWLSEELVMKMRYGADKARQHFAPIKGSLPGADYPLSIVQIDHTKLDVILVDEVYRRPVDRPWITLAIDVYSRMIAGMYVSFDPPGAIGTGMCISNAILSKESWLAGLEVSGEWPVWGKMKTLHMDNAKEFRGNMIKRAAEEYGINIIWRPVKQPQYGGHIERLMDTLKEEIHNLPGTTFSNVKQREKYPSEKKAVMTLKELEKWLATYIVNVYHERLHKGIGMSPINKFREGILGNGTTKGIGLPQGYINEKRVRLDFLPFIERSIQDYGVQIDLIHYYSDVLRKWINAMEVGDKKGRTKRKFIFKRDPRDISVLYFYDPEIKDYFEIPYRDLTHPPITIWEYNEIERWLRKQGMEAIDEAKIFEGLRQMREIESKAKDQRTKARRIKKAAKKDASMIRSSKQNISLSNTSNAEYIQEDNDNNYNVEPFEDIDYGTFA